MLEDLINSVSCMRKSGCAITELLLNGYMIDPLVVINTLLHEFMIFPPEELERSARIN